jgi:hypothetical protein
MSKGLCHCDNCKYLPARLLHEHGWADSHKAPSLHLILPMHIYNKIFSSRLVYSTTSQAPKGRLRLTKLCLRLEQQLGGSKEGVTALLHRKVS